MYRVELNTIPRVDPLENALCGINTRDSNIKRGHRYSLELSIVVSHDHNNLPHQLHVTECDFIHDSLHVGTIASRIRIYVYASNFMP